MMQWSEENQDMAGSQAAMVRAARRARDLAKQNGQPLAFWRDGKVVRVSPDELPPLPDEAPKKAE